MVAILISSGLLICFLIVLFKGINNIPKVIKRKIWFATEGKVVASKIYDTSVRVGTMSKIKPMNTSVSKKNEAYIEYEYNVDGKPYASTNFYSAPLSKLTIDDILFFTDGSTQKVWYNPRDPREAYLKASAVYPSVLYILFGGVGSGFFALLLLGILL